MSCVQRSEYGIRNNELGLRIYNVQKLDVQRLSSEYLTRGNSLLVLIVNISDFYAISY